MTNAEYARTAPVFLKACELAKVKPTARQASKFRMRWGQAWEHAYTAYRKLNDKPMPAHWRP